MLKITLLVLLVAPCLVFGTTCESPKHSASTFSTVDGFFHFSTTYIAEFALQCANNIRDAPFYAVINGKSYQLDHPSSGSQTFEIKIYDEDKFSEYKKAERQGDDVTSVSPLFTISHYHAGVSRKSPISPEIVFLILSSVALYYASVFKAQLKH
uniref:Translocon-associated protein subunit delta n=1 Tax=Ditylenchus dipsaci TaxID=166011 RepID=A0A915DEG7_9BILA